MAVSGTSSKSDNVTLWNEFLGLDPKKTGKQEHAGKLRDRIFEDLDADEDRRLNRKETGLKIEDFKAFDSDNDGLLSEMELKRGLVAQQKGLMMFMNNEHKLDGGGKVSVSLLLDGDKDGVASGQELAYALPDQWQLKKKSSNKVTMDGQSFTKWRQALLYASANFNEVFDAATSNAIEDETLLKNVLA